MQARNYVGKYVALKTENIHPDPSLYIRKQQLAKKMETKFLGNPYL